jgi:hypothetical protein
MMSAMPFPTMLVPSVMPMRDDPSAEQGNDHPERGYARR